MALKEPTSATKKILFEAELLPQQTFQHVRRYMISKGKPTPRASGRSQAFPLSEIKIQEDAIHLGNKLTEGITGKLKIQIFVE